MIDSLVATGELDVEQQRLDQLLGCASVHSLPARLPRLEEAIVASASSAEGGSGAARGSAQLNIDRKPHDSSCRLGVVCCQESQRRDCARAGWQLFRLAVPFATAMEAEGPGAAQLGGWASISEGSATSALGSLLPGLRRCPRLLQRLVRGISAPAAEGRRVSLPSWLNAVACLQPDAAESTGREYLCWRLCGGGPGRIRDGGQGATIEGTADFLCEVLLAIRGHDEAGDDGSPWAHSPRGRRAATSTARAALRARVAEEVRGFYVERDRSWLKRSSVQHGLGRKSTARLLRGWPEVWDALSWGSALCLGVPIPPHHADA